MFADWILPAGCLFISFLMVPNSRAGIRTAHTDCLTVPNSCAGIRTDFGSASRHPENDTASVLKWGLVGRPAWAREMWAEVCVPLRTEAFRTYMWLSLLWPPSVPSPYSTTVTKGEFFGNAVPSAWGPGWLPGRDSMLGSTGQVSWQETDSGYNPKTVRLRATSPEGHAPHPSRLTQLLPPFEGVQHALPTQSPSVPRNLSVAGWPERLYSCHHNLFFTALLQDVYMKILPSKWFLLCWKVQFTRSIFRLLVLIWSLENRTEHTPDTSAILDY